MAGDLLPRVEGLLQQPDFHCAPPVTGGKNATSSPSRTGWSGRAYSMLTATSILTGRGICADRLQTSAALVMPLLSIMSWSFPNFSRMLAKYLTVMLMLYN